ncbi:HIT-like protein [Amniculicola lignicola CBS 123094]|uniref:HIT-like protein n=1 Tax=Amniculicola lignicola CBS 123094 TaxID=1392246 RepID=A0A6A5WTL3_9PLEO|nr:HIT-like protein [Amniculicola lignicola CBS 123094]
MVSISNRLSRTLRYNSSKLKKELPHTSTMASSNSPLTHSNDAITAEEIAGTAKPHDAPTYKPEKRFNAFTELMAPKKPKPSSPGISPQRKSKYLPSVFDRRDGLGLYITHPEQNPEGRVVEYDDEFVVIQDKFAKASVHLLLLARDPTIYRQEATEVLTHDPIFLAKVQARIPHLKQLVASELRRLYGQHSASDKPYQEALEGLMSSPDPPSESDREALLPLGRDWLSEVRCGIHTHPSMHHLHIHIFSRDMYSPCLKHKKHYLSFTSSFLIDVVDFPLNDKGEDRRGMQRLKINGWNHWDMKCWRCGRNFKNQFKSLKEHMEGEFEEWKKE